MFILTLTPTPTPVPPAEVVEQAVRVIDVFQSLGPLMALLFVVALALAVVMVISYFNRGSTSTALTVVANAAAQKDKELAELKAQWGQDRQRHVESPSAIANQANRANDLFEAMNKRGIERDKQQQRMVENQDRIAASFDVLLHEGSAPLRVVANDVAAIMLKIGELDNRTSNWQAAMNDIPLIRADFNSRLDKLLAEMAKRSTKPIPQVQVPETTNGETPTP